MSHAEDLLQGTLELLGPKSLFVERASWAGVSRVVDGVLGRGGGAA